MSGELIDLKVFDKILASARFTQIVDAKVEAVEVFNYEILVWEVFINDVVKLSRDYSRKQENFSFPQLSRHIICENYRRNALYRENIR